jgi:hypothetical protein
MKRYVTGGGAVHMNGGRAVAGTRAGQLVSYYD